MYKKLIFTPLLILAALIFVGPLAAQTIQEVTALLEVPQDSQLTVGDPIEMKLIVNHPADHHVIFQDIGSEWGNFIVKSQSAPVTIENDDGTKTSSQIIDARLFQPGAFETPPLSLVVADGAGQLLEVPVPPASVSIASVLVEGDTTLRDIKPQVDLPYLNLLPLIAVGGLIAAMSILALLLWRRGKNRRALAEIDSRLPHEVALDQLKSIKALGLPDKGRFKKHYTLVSETIRNYMGKTYHFPVLERTTAEIHTSLKKTAVPPTVAREFLSLLEESDLVKFSKFVPTTSDAYSTLALAFTIVEETKPIELTPAPPTNNGKQSLKDSASVENPRIDRGISSNGKLQQTEVRT